MAKRPTSVGNNKRSHSHKTAKRLAIKKQALEILSTKRGN